MNRIRTMTGERAGASVFTRALIFVLPGLWVGSVVALGSVVPGRIHVAQLLAAAPAIACAGSGRRWCVLTGGGCALFALFPLSNASGPEGYEVVLGHVMAILPVIGASYLITGRRARLTRELERVREVAVAAQRVLLRPLPRRVESLSVASDYLSATCGAQIGGDLYEVLATPHGVRVILGDVRGHGLSAVGTVAALLGCFREAAHDEAELTGVLGRLDRSLARHLRERARTEHPAVALAEPLVPVAEEFATVLLLELRPDDGLSVLNCGHPSPYLIDIGPDGLPQVTVVRTEEPMPPLGVLDPGTLTPRVQHSRLLPGQALFLYTDGAEEARDASGGFFPLSPALHNAARCAVADGPLDPAVLVGTTRAALLDHADRRLADDVALLALCREPLCAPQPRDDPADRPAAEAQL